MGPPTLLRISGSIYYFDPFKLLSFGERRSPYFFSIRKSIKASPNRPYIIDSGGKPICTHTELHTIVVGSSYLLPGRINHLALLLIGGE